MDTTIIAALISGFFAIVTIAWALLERSKNKTLTTQIEDSKSTQGEILDKLSMLKNDLAKQIKEIQTEFNKELKRIEEKTATNTEKLVKELNNHINEILSKINLVHIKTVEDKKELEAMKEDVKHLKSLYKEVASVKVSIAQLREKLNK